MTDSKRVHVLILHMAFCTQGIHVLNRACWIHSWDQFKNRCGGPTYTHSCTHTADKAM